MTGLCTRSEIETILDLLNSDLLAAHELSTRKRQRESIEETNPRLFAKTYTGEPAPTPEPAAQEGLFDSDDAAWLPG